MSGKNFCKVENKWCKFLKRGVCGYSKTAVDLVNRCPRLAEIETIRLGDIIKEVKFEKVFERLCVWFDDQANSESGYRHVFEDLLTRKPKKHNLSDMFINISSYTHADGDWLDVEGVEPGKKKYYGIEFCPWDDWISMFITQKTLDSFDKETIVAACLYEMTFFGFTEDKIENKKNELRNSIEDMKKEIESKKN